MGYIPDMNRATGPFTGEQIEYLRPRKFEEYRTMGTRTVFAMGAPSLNFHVYGTGEKITAFAEAVDGEPIDLGDGFLIIPLPHPGGQGILNYLRARNKTSLNAGAQDSVFRELVNKGLRSIGLERLSRA